MDLFSALTTAVAGTQAQSFAMSSISDNIANSQTTGYKRVDARFSDLVTDAPVQLQQGGSVQASSQGTTRLTGSLKRTNVPTNFALNGDGFITVRQKQQSGGGPQSFSGTNLFTRRGDFSLDTNGYLVNGAGYCLVGSTLDPASGQPTGAAPDVIKVTQGFAPAQASTTLTYVANLPATPHTSSYDPTKALSDVWNAGTTPPASVAPGTIPSSADFVSHSVDGQSVRFYDSVGRPVDVGLRWAKLGATPAPGTGTRWALYAETGSGQTAGSSTWSLAGQVSFDSSGNLLPTTTSLSLPLAARGLGTIAFDLNGDALRQLDDSTGQVTVSSMTQDGASSGALDDLQITSDGRVMGSYSNGQLKPLALISIAQFKAPDLLKRENGSAFTETAESGTPIFDPGTLTFNSGSVEGSNTDIADEFSKLIVTQQAYAANTKVMSTVQEMLSGLMNTVR